ncbi:helix-turn-helix domain-containing protein [Yoonia sp.]|uniref:helix-turn-helix domain-containing protein n=1 Tax=Yoonia sp. TaxID=2212373 RepID=UPI00390C7C8E
MTCGSWRRQGTDDAASRSHIKKNIGHSIRQARKEKNLTQKDLACLSGVWKQAISKSETGNSGTKLETIFNPMACVDGSCIARHF